MYKEILRSIAGIDVFPVVSLCLFVAVFAVVLVKALRADRERLAAYANLPLDPSAKETHPSAAESDRGAEL